MSKEKVQLLDSAEEIEKQDRNGLLSVSSRIHRQLEEALALARQVEYRPEGHFENVVIVGMGGSAIGGDLVRGLLGRRLSLPAEVLRNYEAPPYVGTSTLALISSYSGETEETLTAFQGMRKRGAFCVVLTSGGELESLARRHNLPAYHLPEGLPPRAALPYSFVSILGALQQAEILRESVLEELENSLDWVQARVRALGPAVPSRDNPAKKLALALDERIPVIYGSRGRLFPVARRWANQFCENGKGLAYSGELPEMNHNEVVGWEHPPEAVRSLTPIFLRDQDDHPRIQVRLEVTRELLSSRVDPVLEFWSSGENWMERFWSLILLGDFASLYKALLNREDPSSIDAIEQLKMRLKQS